MAKNESTNEDFSDVIEARLALKLAQESRKASRIKFEECDRAFVDAVQAVANALRKHGIYGPPV